MSSVSEFSVMGGESQGKSGEIIASDGVEEWVEMSYNAELNSYQWLMDK